MYAEVCKTYDDMVLNFVGSVKFLRAIKKDSIKDINVVKSQDLYFILINHDCSKPGRG